MGKANFTEDLKLHAIKQIAERGTRSLTRRSVWRSACISVPKDVGGFRVSQALWQCAGPL